MLDLGYISDGKSAHPILAFAEKISTTWLSSAGRKHPTNMAHSIFTTYNPKHPNFLLVVILSGVTLIALLVVFYFLIADKGRKLLPGLHHDPQPTSYVLPPASDMVQS